MQDMYDYNVPYQAPLKQDDAKAQKDLDLKDPAVFDQCLGKDECYADFLNFFEHEIEERGLPAVLREYMLKGDDRANDIFCRMYTDLVHPMIHLGCGLEFKQPSLVAEALSGACVHESWPKTLLLPTEDYIRSNPKAPSKPLLEILESLRSDPEITSAVKASDPFNKIPDGLLKRIGAKQLAPYLAQFQVKPTEEDVRRKMSEMMHVDAFMMGAAQHPDKLESMDFVLLHAVTLCVFYPAILAQDWLSIAEKARLVEAKGRFDAVMYAGCGCPPLYPRRISDYKPRHPEHGWPELFQRANVYFDEGHVAKLIRALFSLDSLPELRDPGAAFPIAKEDFRKIAHMALDSVERALEADGHKMPQQVADGVAKQVGIGGNMVVANMQRWVFYGGLEKTWQYVADSEVSAH